VVLKEESVSFFFICTGVEYSARPSTQCVWFVRANADWEGTSEAPASKIKLVPLNPLKTKVVGKTGITSEKKAIRVRLPTQDVGKTGETQFILQESIYFFLCSLHIRWTRRVCIYIYIYIYKIWRVHNILSRKTGETQFILQQSIYFFLWSLHIRWTRRVYIYI
jgi:hypothetical protein